MLVGVRTIALPLPTHVRLSGAVTVVPEFTHCKVLEKDMAPLILDIEEDEEDTDHHGDNDADHHHQTTVHPPACSQVVRFGGIHLPSSSSVFVLPLLSYNWPSSVFSRYWAGNARLRKQLLATGILQHIKDTITSKRETATD